MCSYSYGTVLSFIPFYQFLVVAPTDDILYAGFNDGVLNILVGMPP